MILLCKTLWLFSDKVYGKPCACDEKEVCVALVNELVPHCVKMIDPTDPTGCGGHCKLNVQICQRIRGNAYRYGMAVTKKCCTYRNLYSCKKYKVTQI